jgi:formamidopyrimidine-DNA glycosylase
MPELPDVETFKRRLDNTAAGRRITNAKVIDARLLDGISARSLCAVSWAGASAARKGTAST